MVTLARKSEREHLELLQTLPKSEAVSLNAAEEHDHSAKRLATDELSQVQAVP